MKSEIIPYDLIRPNPWNPNVMVESTYRAELESILEFGFIDPATVRENEGREIIDGEHRWRAFGELRAKWLLGESELEIFGIKVTWDDGTIHPCHESLVTCFETNEIPVSNLGIISDAQAKRLTLILNETRGKSNTVDVAALLAEIAAEMGGEGLGRGLPYSGPELEELLKLSEYDWNTAANTPESSGGGGGEGENSGEMLTLTLMISDAGHSVLLDAFEKMKAKLAQDEISMHENPKIALGQIVEALAVHFLEK